MCIRALDYCPSVDITFGEYLRALDHRRSRSRAQMTALNYRVAFMEAVPQPRHRCRRTFAPFPRKRWRGARLRTHPPPVERLSKVLDLASRSTGTPTRAARRSTSSANGTAGSCGTTVSGPSSARRGPRHNLCGQLDLLPMCRATTPKERFFTGRPRTRANDVRCVQRPPARRVSPDGTIRDRDNRDDPAAPAGPDRSQRCRERLLLVPRRSDFHLRPAGRAQEIRYEHHQEQPERDTAGASAAGGAGCFTSPLRSLYFGNEKSEPFAMLHASYSAEEHDDGP